MTTTTTTLAQAIDHYGVDVYDHLDRELSIPIIAGKPQRQGRCPVPPPQHHQGCDDPRP